MNRLKRNTDIVWDNDFDKRYVPKANGPGGGWDVYDKVEKRFVSSDELRGMPPEILRDMPLRLN